MLSVEVRASIREIPHRDLHAPNAAAASAQAARDGFEVVEELDGGVVDALEFGVDVVPVEGDDGEPAGAVSFWGQVVSEVHVSGQ